MTNGHLSLISSNPFLDDVNDAFYHLCDDGLNYVPLFKVGSVQFRPRFRLATFDPSDINIAITDLVRPGS